MLLPTSPSCVCTKLYQCSLQCKIFLSKQNFLTNADASRLLYQCNTEFIKDNPLLRTYSLCVADTLYVVTSTPAVSVINVALHLLTITPYCIRVGNASRAEMVFRFGASALQFVEDTFTQERGSKKGYLLFFLYFSLSFSYTRSTYYTFIFTVGPICFLQVMSPES